MTDQHALHYFLDAAAHRRPQHYAVVEPRVSAISYEDLQSLSNRMRDRLIHLGVRRGDRVGIYVRKSIDSVAAIFGVLKAGAAYVPVDPFGPPARNAYILNDCSVRAVVMERFFTEKLQAELNRMGGSILNPIFLAKVGGGRFLSETLAREQENDPAPAADTVATSPGDLAYILYTSGSTGKPKGVMLSHENATSYVHWCSEAFQPNQDDR